MKKRLANFLVSCALSAPRVSRIVGVLAAASLPALGSGVNVLTQHNDVMRSGANLSETVLTPANVNSGQFGKLFDQTVDGYVYAQPLVMTGVNITTGSNRGMHNVVFIATEHDSVFAFDADSNSGANAQPLWMTSFINVATGISSVPNDDVGTTDIVPEIGITSTPVIDAATGTLYVLAKTKKFDPANAADNSAWSYHQHLHALDIHTGLDKPGSPVEIKATVLGNGDGNNGDGTLSFDPLREHNRPGLLLLNGVVYIAWASHGDNGPYHGWIIGYNKTTLAQVGVFNTTPDGGLGGVWMSGTGLAADTKGNIYFSTGNGTFDVDSNGVHVGNNYGDSVLKLGTTPAGALYQSDYFTPFNQNDLNNADADLGSGGVLLLPDQAGAHPHLAITCGKEGKIYVLDRDHMGQFHPGIDSIVQVMPGAIGGTWSTSAYFNGKVYYHGSGDFLKAFDLVAGRLSDEPTAQGSNNFGFPAATPSISANGAQNGIVWELQSNAPAILYAYDAKNVATELYDSNQAANNRDNPGGNGGVKFAVPTIANGRVFVGSQGTLSVFGLFHTQDTLNVSTGGSGSGTVTPAFAGATSRTVNQSYTIMATPAANNVFAGWKDVGTGNVISHAATLTFTMKLGLTLEADFVPNPFTAVTGIYAGYTVLQTQSYQLAGGAGFSVNSTGGFTGSVKLGGTTYPLNGVFLTDGTYSITIPRAGKPAVSILLQLDVSNNTNQITGTITDGQLTGYITSNRPAPPPASKRYTLVLPPSADTSQPQGDGYGTLTVDSRGNLTFAGVLGDGSAVTQSAVVAGNGQWLFYVAPYRANGSATGVITFGDNGSSDLNGTIRWYKPATGSPQILCAIAAYGSAYDPTAAPILALTKPATFTITGGGLNVAPTPKTFTLSGSNKLLLQPGSTGLTLSFTTATGHMAGVFTDAAGQTHGYSGVVFQRGTSGNGLFIANGKAGSVVISD